MKRILWILVLLSVATGVWWMYRPREMAVDLADVSRGPIRSFVEEEGMTRVVDRFVVSAPVGGRLRRVDLERGDTVEKGKLIAEIDPLPLRAKIEETEAQMNAMRHRLEGIDRKKPKKEELERARIGIQVARDAVLVSEREIDEARASLVVAGKEMDRVRKLARTSTAAAAELDQAEATEEAARARVAAAEARVKIKRLQVETARLQGEILEKQLGDFDWQKEDYADQITALEARLKSLRDDLRRTKVPAPVSGVVLDLVEESERVLVAGAPILELGQLTRLEVEADFLSEDAAHMHPGMKAEIFGRALGTKVLPATVKRVNPSAFRKISSLGVEQQRVKVILDFPASGLGDRYRVEARVILDDRDDVVLAPEGALFRHEGSWHVFRMVDETARLTPVKTGLRDGRFREVVEGLDEGARVILHPDDTLEHGDRVKPLQE